MSSSHATSWQARCKCLAKLLEVNKKKVYYRCCSQFLLPPPPFFKGLQISREGGREVVGHDFAESLNVLMNSPLSSWRKKKRGGGWGDNTNMTAQSGGEGGGLPLLNPPFSAVMFARFLPPLPSSFGGLNPPLASLSPFINVAFGLTYVHVGNRRTHVQRLSRGFRIQPFLSRKKCWIPAEMLP